MNFRHPIVLLALGFICSQRLHSPALAQSMSNDGISVSGIGIVKVRPNIVEFDSRIVAKAELADDVMVKFQHARSKAKEALEALKLKNLSIKELGVVVTPGSTQAAIQAMQRGMPVADADRAQLELSSVLRVQVTEIGAMPAEEMFKMIGRVLDTARDAGLSVGPSTAEAYRAYQYGRQSTGGLLKFVVRDFAPAREQAYEQAFADARSRAIRLARLSGLTLGSAVAINEVQVSGDDTQQQQVVQYGAYVDNSGLNQAPEQPTITTDSFGDVAVRVRLQVRFSTPSEGPKTAQHR